MTQQEVEEGGVIQRINLESLNNGYKPFPSFAEWIATTSINQQVWERKIQTVQHLKGLNEEVLNRAREVATRAAAIDTGAIEGLYEVDRGFTYTVAVENGAWEAAVNTKGGNFKVLFEAQLRAYEYILDWATTNKPITEHLIRTLHSEICKEQDTYTVQTAVGPQEHALPKGEYKTQPNHVLQRNGKTHSYCPVTQTVAEMQRLVSELQSDDFIKASAAQQSAYSHYAFVSIHPFSDGNGRVARALASVYTYRELCAPLLILLDNRDEYFEALSLADSGEYQPIVSFIFERACNSIELIEESVRTAEAKSLTDSIKALKKIYYTPSGYTHDLIDQAALEIARHIVNEVNNLAVSIADKHWTIKAELKNGHNSQFEDYDGYRNLISGTWPAVLVVVTADSDKPKISSASLSYRIVMPAIAGAGEKIVLFQLNQTQEESGRDVLEFGLETCIPQIAISTDWRLRMFAERVLAQLLHELAN